MPSAYPASTKKSGPIATCQLVIIGIVPVNDHDLILRTITDTWGKISLYTKQARKGAKRFGGPLDLFLSGHASIKRAGSELPLLAGLERRKHLISVDSSLGAFACANLFAQALDHLCQDGDTSTPQLFGVTTSVFEELRQDPAARSSLKAVTSALHQLLVINGFIPGGEPLIPSPRTLRTLVATIESLTHRPLHSMDAVETIMNSLSETA